MKIIIFLSILLAIASSQCVGYKADGTCYNPYSDTNQSYGWGYINYCAKYSIDPPNTCDTCLDGLTGKTCYDTTKYPHLFRNKGTTGVDDQYNCYFAEDDMNWWDHTHRAGYVFPWTSYTCVDANKQFICNCNEGFVFVAGQATYGSCKACGTGCYACSAADQTKCTTCYGWYFLDAGACTKCDDNAMTCASKTAAATCSPGYYVETTGKCTPCPDANSYCKSKDDYGTCKPTFYYDTTAKKCTTCGTNAYLCNAAPVSGADTGIDECKEPDASSVYFKTSKGCVASTTTNKCKTVIADGTKCASCFTGYVIDTGVCKFCKSSIYFTGTERQTNSVSHTYDEIILTCTPGTDSTAAKVTCKEGYYLDTVCKPCFAGCDKCSGGDGQVAEKCQKIAAGYTKISTTVVTCAHSSNTTHLNCATCNDGVSPADNKCLTVTAGSGWGILTSTGLTYECYGDDTICTECTMTSATVFTSCTKGVDYAYKESALNHMKSGTAWPIFTCPTNYVKCTAKDKSSADGMELDQGTACTVTGFVLQKVGTTTFTCEAEGSSGNFVNCAEGTFADPTKTCTKCDDGFTLAAGACTVCATAASHTKANGTECVALVANCASGKNYIETDIAKCSSCTDNTYLLLTDKTVCLACSTVTHCKTVGGVIQYVASSDKTACNCSLCDNGYYISSGLCVNDTIENCISQINDGTTAKCTLCKFGTKWDGTKCKTCDQTSFKCATSGCADLEYPGKAGAGSNTAGSDSALLKVIFALLLSIMTLLI